MLILLCSLMKFEDQLRSHPSYFKAAIEATEIYVQIFDDPSLTEVKLSESSYGMRGLQLTRCL